jgi:hypothetical protein
MDDPAASEKQEFRRRAVVQFGSEFDARISRAITDEVNRYITDSDGPGPYGRHAHPEDR